MSNVSTFGAFTMAKLGIYASQKAMQVTGNNITNINTVGYTRQTLDLNSLYVGGADRYASKWDAKVGSGVLVSGVSQIRSPYLDIRYRTEYSNVGKAEKTLDGLNGLSQIFDEVGKGEDDEGVMESALQDMIERLTHYVTEGSGEGTFDTILKGSMSEVVNIFNIYAGKLEDLYNNTKESLQEDVKTVNSILSNIRSLNNAIRKAEIHGGNALELKDERNLEIDKLSKYIRINVIYEEEDIGAGCVVDKLTIRLNGGDESENGHDGILLVDGKYATQLKVPDVNVPEERPAPACTGMFDVTLDALRDVRGNPKMLVDGSSAICVSGPQQPLTAPGNLTIGGYTVPVTLLDKNALGQTPTEAEQLEHQLRQFKEAYNSDPANTQWRATLSMDKTGIVFTAADSTSETVTALTQDGELTVNGYSVVIRNAANKTLEEQLKEFQSVYNSDPNNEPNYVTISADKQQLIFTTPRNEPLTPGSEPPGTTLAIDGVKPVPDPDNTDVTLTDTDLYGALQSTREMLTEEGAFASKQDIVRDPSATAKRGIPYYQKIWDAMASKLAGALNEANSLEDANGDLKRYETGEKKGQYIVQPKNYYVTDKDGNYLGADGQPITLAPGADPDDPASYKEFKKDQDGDFVDANGNKLTPPYLDADGNDMRVLTDIRVVREQYKGGILFSNSGDNDDPTGITAKNLSIAHSWANGSIHVMQSRDDTELDQSTANSNLLHMLAIVRDNNFTYMLSDMDDDFAPGNAGGNTDVQYFKGSFGDMLTEIGSTLGKDTKVIQDRLVIASSSLVELEVDRDSVSGVDLNDEAIAMMQYNKSYSAACRFMTTIDEMLDKLINGTAL